VKGGPARKNNKGLATLKKDGPGQGYDNKEERAHIRKEKKKLKRS